MYLRSKIWSYAWNQFSESTYKTSSVFTDPFRPAEGFPQRLNLYTVFTMHPFLLVGLQVVSDNVSSKLVNQKLAEEVQICLKMGNLPYFPVFSKNVCNIFPYTFTIVLYDH